MAVLSTAGGDPHTPVAAHLRECADCGLVQRVAGSQAHDELACARCASRLQHASPDRSELAAACAGVAALFLLIALSEPFFEIHLLGRYAAASLLSTPRVLAERGLPELSLVVVATLVVAPVLHLGILALAVVGAHLPNPRRSWFLPLGLKEAVRRWSMIDVFLLAALVCYVRLRSWANVEIGGAVAALVALILVTLVAELAVNPRALWERIPHQSPRSPRPDARLVACAWCELVSQTPEGGACPRCGRSVHARKRESVTRARAYLVGAALLCVPANLLPVMDMTRFGRSSSKTIFSGVLELTQNGLWGLAAIIFVASIVIPLLKIGALAIMLFTNAGVRPEQLSARTKALRIVRDLGRWSLVDVYAVAILVALVHMGIIANVLPGYGAVAFCGVVILTMLSAESYDPRLMWDAAGWNGAAERVRAT